MKSKMMLMIFKSLKMKMNLNVFDITRMHKKRSDVSSLRCVLIGNRLSGCDSR